MRKTLFIFLLFGIFTDCKLWSQANSIPAMDTVAVKGRSFILLGDSSIFIERDTVIYLPDSIASKLKFDNKERSADFYKRIKQRLYKRKFTKELYNLLFKDLDKKNTPKIVPKRVRYDIYNGRRIREVRIKRLSPFGTSIRDTLKTPKGWAVKTANGLHAKTRRRIIKNNLFFNEGDVFSDDLIVDSERIIRSLPFIKDARIYVVKEERQSVDLLILIKDVWSISVDADFGGVDNTDFSVSDRNFLGLGHEFTNELLFDQNNTPKVGYGGTYAINNINNTFITAEFNWVQSATLERTRIRFTKNFITPEIKYAGGVEWNEERVEQSRVLPDTTIRFFTKFNFQDLWLGRSLIVKEDESGRMNLQFASAFSRIRFSERVPVESDTNQAFFDRNTYLLSVGIAKRSYERSSLITGFGRTEDIPKGYLFDIVVGRDISEFDRTTYIGGLASVGNYMGRFGYVRPSFSFGGFIEKQRVERAVIKFDLNYFSYLYRIRRVSFRQFFNINYTNGIRRFTDEFININDENGIRGLSNTFLRGTKRISFNSETIAFTPLYFLGFRMAIYGFADLAIVSSETRALFKNQLYQGYGIGFRFRNENLAFNTLQIRLAWYPKVPPGESSIGFDLDGRTSFNISDFTLTRPEIINFR